MVDSLKAKIENLRNSLEQGSKQGIEMGKKTDITRSFHDFREKKASYYRSSVEGNYNDLKRAVLELAPEAKTQDIVFDLLLLWKELERSKGDMKRSNDVLDRMADLSSKISVSKKPAEKIISLKMPKMPVEIKSEVEADVREIEKCFNNCLYRSATILCGRVLETALHRKYYEATGNDALEKSPGIGLGNLIAKLKEKNIEIDPALTQQIHLVNQVRIFTVHKKKEAFMPSREQAHAIILYTIDVVGRMF